MLLSLPFSLSSCFRTADGGQPGSESQQDGGLGICALLLTVISVLLIIVFLPFSLFFCVKVSILSCSRLHHHATQDYNDRYSVSCAAG